jgi:hypothetical protein
MSYIIKHKQTGKYFNIRHYGLELFGLGINPKIYPDEDAANKELLMFESIKAKQLQIHFNSKHGLEDHAKPSWYNERHTKKLTKRQQEKLDWYEAAQKNTENSRLFVEQLQVTDLVVEKYEH